jgi:hypothetical protein
MKIEIYMNDGRKCKCANRNKQESKKWKKNKMKINLKKLHAQRKS